MRPHCPIKPSAPIPARSTGKASIAGLCALQGFTRSVFFRATGAVSANCRPLFVQIHFCQRIKTVVDDETALAVFSTTLNVSRFFNIMML